MNKPKELSLSFNFNVSYYAVLTSLCTALRKCSAYSDEEKKLITQKVEEILPLLKEGRDITGDVNMLLDIPIRGLM